MVRFSFRICVIPITIFANAYSASQASAQTTETYSYDANGRVVSVNSDTGTRHTYEFDRVNNITRATAIVGNSNNGGGNGNSSNAAPTCTNAGVFSYYRGGSFNGLINCSDPDGDSLVITSITQPSGRATATNSGGGFLQFNNLRCGQNTIVRTVTDGNGGTTTSNYTVTYNGHYGGC